MVAHRVGLFPGRGHQNRHMQHRSNVPTGFDVRFWSWPKWDCRGKTGRKTWRNRGCTVGTFDVTSFMRLECMHPVRHQSKPEIVHVCSSVFMSTEKCPALPRNRLCSEKFFPLIRKTQLAMNSLKAGLLVGGRLNIFPQWHENTLFSFLQSSVQASSVCVPKPH